LTLCLFCYLFIYQFVLKYSSGALTLEIARTNAHLKIVGKLSFKVLSWLCTIEHILVSLKFLVSKRWMWTYKITALLPRNFKKLGIVLDQNFSNPSFSMAPSIKNKTQVKNDYTKIVNSSVNKKCKFFLFCHFTGERPHLCVDCGSAFMRTSTLR
jgi:hypothetical protein